MGRQSGQSGHHLGVDGRIAGGLDDNILDALLRILGVLAEAAPDVVVAQQLEPHVEGHGCEDDPFEGVDRRLQIESAFVTRGGRRNLFESVGAHRGGRPVRGFGDEEAGVGEQVGEQVDDLRGRDRVHLTVGQVVTFDGSFDGSDPRGQLDLTVPGFGVHRCVLVGGETADDGDRDRLLLGVRDLDAFTEVGTVRGEHRHDPVPGVTVLDASGDDDLGIGNPVS